MLLCTCTQKVRTKLQLYTLHYKYVWLRTWLKNPTLPGLNKHVWFWDCFLYLWFPSEKCNNHCKSDMHKRNKNCEHYSTRPRVRMGKFQLSFQWVQRVPRWNDWLDNHFLHYSPIKLSKLATSPICFALFAICHTLYSLCKPNNELIRLAGWTIGCAIIFQYSVTH